MDWNIVNGAKCLSWLVLPTVYSEALSYGEQLNKFCKILNDLIENNNNLPEYVENLISTYISSGQIDAVVKKILADYILNVKYPPNNITPATGDGTADDTEAIQGCIDYAYAQGGGAVYLPSGNYSVQSLTMRNNVALFGFDRYSTKIVLRGGATNPLIYFNGDGCGIYRLTLSANAGVQTENVNVISMIAQNVYIDGLIIEDGYKLFTFNGKGGHLQINDVVFGNAVNECMNISGGSIVQAKGLLFTQLSSVGGVDVINVDSDGGVYELSSIATCETLLVLTGNDNYFIIKENNAVNPYTDSGSNNVIDIPGITKKDYYSGNVSVKIDSNYTTNTQLDFTEDIGGNYSKSVNGGGVYNYDTLSETINKSKNINVPEIVENLTTKTINTAELNINSEEPVTYKTPVKKEGYSTIPAKDSENYNYNIMVENDNTVAFYAQKPVNVLLLGFDNTGENDISDLFNTETQKYPLYFPSGTYKIEKPITLGYPIYGVDGANGIEWGIEDGSNYTKFVCYFDGGYLLNINENSKTANINNIILVMNNHNTGGVSFRPAEVRSVKINNVCVFGLMNATAFSFTPSVVTSKGVWMENCSVFGSNNTKSIGVVVGVNCPDCNINNCMFMAVQKGILCYANILYLNNIHIWNGMYLNVGATREYWELTQGIYLNNTLLFGCNIYIDTSRILIACENGTHNRASISNLIVWFDNSAEGVDLNDASLFLDLSQTSVLFINGGYIYGGNKLQHCITDSVRASNVMVASDKDFDATYHNIFPTYPRVNINNYELLGLYKMGTNYQEICRMWYQYGGTAIINIADADGNTVELRIFKSTTSTLEKVTLHGTINLWYKITNNILIIFAENPTNDYRITYLVCDDELGGLIYPLVDKLNRLTGFTRLSQTDNSGLTVIPEKESV